MPKQNHAKNPLLAVFLLIGQILIAIGNPVLLLSKLLLFFTTALGDKLITIGELSAKTLIKKTKAIKVAKITSKIKVNRPEAPDLTPLRQLWDKLHYRGLSLFKKYLELFLDKLSELKISIIKMRASLEERITLIRSKTPTVSAPHFSFHFRFKSKRRINVSKPPSKKTSFEPLRHFHLPKTPRLLTATIASVSATIVVFLVFYFSFFIFNNLPHPRLLAQKPVPLTTKIYDRNGILLYQFYSDQNRTLAKLPELPPYVPEAIIAAEDKNFYHHIGFDPAGITRAAIANYNGDSAQGGSTITQQLVKFSLLTPERTVTRKIRELILSLWAERIYSKDEILTMYMNYIGFGGPAYGIEAASEIYFGKSARNLSLPEAALLASLPSAPTTYSPFGKHPELAKFRQIQVLDKMHQLGYITKTESDQAKKTQLTFVPVETEIKAPHFVMYVKDQLVEQFGEQALLEGGLKVTTTLDYNLYKKTSDTLKTGVDNQRYLNVQNGAALVTNPKTGDILAMIGSVDFFDLTKDGNVNVTVAQRSPGSSIKPLTYALAFENNLITPNTLIEDRPTQFRQIGGPIYRPTNYDNRFHSKVTARTALGSSYNIPAVKVLDRIGVINFLQFASNAGLTTLDDPNRFGLSITLGGGEIKMTDMAQAYSMFPNQGKSVPLKSILEIEDSQGNLLNMPLTFSRSLISPKSAFYINSILSDDTARAPTFGRGSILNIPGHTVAVKTGTTETKRDNWTIGYSFGDNPRLVAVWVGNNDNSPMSPYLESGNTGAAAIWNPIIQEVLKDQPNAEVPKPEDLIAVQICPLTGTLPCANCPYTVTEFFIRGTEPKVACNLSKEEMEKMKENKKN